MLWKCLSHPWQNLYSCFCFFVVVVFFIVCLFLISVLFFCFFVLAKRKEEEWHMATRGELWHSQSKLSDAIVVGRVNLIRSNQRRTIDQSIEVHYCSMGFKQAQPAISVLGRHWVMFVCLLKYTHGETSHDTKPSDWTGKDSEIIAFTPWLRIKV